MDIKMCTRKKEKKKNYWLRGVKFKHLNQRIPFNSCANGGKSFIHANTEINLMRLRQSRYWAQCPTPRHSLTRDAERPDFLAKLVKFTKPKRMSKKLNFYGAEKNKFCKLHICACTICMQTA